MGKGIVKLGEGKWAVKDGNLLAAKETNGRFKNTEFTVSRGTRASYVGRDGLIKESNLQDVNLVNNGDFSELSSELVTNGTFDTDSDWTIQNNTGTDTEITSGNLIIETDGAYTQVSQSSILVGGNQYKLIYTILSSDNGDLGLVTEGNLTVSIPSSVGTHTYYFTAHSTSFILKRRGGALNVTIDNISVKEVDPNDYWIAHTGWSIEDGEGVADNSSSYIKQNNVIDNNKTFKIQFDTVVTSGQFRLVATADAATYTSYVTESGSYTFYMKPTVSINGGLEFVASSFTGTIDNLVVNEVKTDTPRIDFTDNTDGHLLLEPQSTNLVTHSEDFTNSSWAKTNCTINSNNSISPDGTQNADKLDFTTSNGEIVRTTSFVSGQEYTMSFYAKTESGTLDFNYGNMDYTMNSGTATTEWQRFEITQTLPSATRFPKIQTTEIGSLLLWGFQIEQLSHSTSYIATNGSTVTRDADTCTGAGEAIDFNSEEGVLYAEIAALADDGTFRVVSLNSGDNTNIVKLGYRTTSNAIYYEVRSGDVSQSFQIYTTTDIKQFNKVALLYKENDFKLFVNGVNVLSDTSGITPVGLNNLSFEANSGAYFYGKCKAIRVYKEALSDTDLQNLTS